MTQPQKSAMLSTAIDAARAAEEVIRGYYDAQPAIQIKPDNTPVTAADIEAEKTIYECIHRSWPDHGFLGEETGADASDSDYLWLVDPIDGTKSFVRQYPFFSTQIALLHNDDLVLGVSNAPMFAELGWAERGSGSFLNGQRCAVSKIDSLAECTISTGNLTTLASGKQWTAFGELVTRVNRVRGYGDFYHYHLLASGKIDVVIESDVNILDIAALSIMVEESGGRFTDLDGKKIGLDSTSVLASNGTLHDQVLDSLAGRA